MDLMAALGERDQLLSQYMKEWEDLDLDLVLTVGSMMPAPLKVCVTFYVKFLEIACCIRVTVNGFMWGVSLYPHPLVFYSL